MGRDFHDLERVIWGQEKSSFQAGPHQEARFWGRSLNGSGSQGTGVAEEDVVRRRKGPMPRERLVKCLPHNTRT